MPKFRNANGDVSAYGFACGHVQSWTTDGQAYYSTNANGVQLSLDGVWHVRTRSVGETHDADGYGVRGPNGALLGWESFDSLTEARKAFRSAIRRVKSAA
jgi:hypothetical protein